MFLVAYTVVSCASRTFKQSLVFRAERTGLVLRSASLLPPVLSLSFFSSSWKCDRLDLSADCGLKRFEDIRTEDNLKLASLD